SKPARNACPLLLTRARLLNGQAKAAEALDAVEAICSLGADSAEDFAALIPAIGECVRITDGIRSTSLIDARCQAVRRQSVHRAISLLAQAVARGFADGSALEQDSSLSWLQREPSFQSLVRRWNSSPSHPHTSAVPAAGDR